MSIAEMKARNPSFLLKLCVALMVVILCRPLPSSSFALLAHEAIIDATWEKSLLPLLKEKYPDATAEDLKKAHAYVYGGAIIPDIGYYPLGSHFFSDLTHYVRTGDFIKALLEESHNLNEYAFALGVLCHYEADSYGHSLGTNKAVPILFPKLQKKYGDVVTFEQGRNQHARVEFGFDVFQTAKGNYQPESYHDFIGFEVSDSVLDRAFFKTYGLKLSDVFTSVPAAIAVFRVSVKALIPELTKTAWKIENSFITKINPLATKQNFRYKVDKKQYRKEFEQPKLQSYIVMLVIGVLPKYGPLSKFKPAMPDSTCEKLFDKSFNTILTNYSSALKKLEAKDASFTDMDMDTGKKTAMGEYHLGDDAYYKLLMKQKKNKFAHTDAALKKNLLAFYSTHDASQEYGAHTHKGKKVSRALEELNTATVSAGVQAH